MIIRAYSARVFGVVVHCSFVVLEAVGSVECFRAWCTGLGVDIVARKRFRVFMFNQDVLSQSFVFSKSRVTAVVPTASVLLFILMRFQMSAQPRASRESFVATFPGTYMISNSRMGTFEVMLQVSLAQVRLRAEGMGTFERSIPGMGSEVLF